MTRSAHSVQCNSLIILDCDREIHLWIENRATGNETDRLCETLMFQSSPHFTLTETSGEVVIHTVRHNFLIRDCRRLPWYSFLVSPHPGGSSRHFGTGTTVLRRVHLPVVIETTGVLEYGVQYLRQRFHASCHHHSSPRDLGIFCLVDSRRQTWILNFVL